ncbi:hypothetical protein ACER0C_004907 [Sarotherodon galilaeus]
MASHRQQRESMYLDIDFSLPQSSSETKEQPSKPQALPVPDLIQTMNISSRYKVIISNSVLISSGPPAVYQLRPKKEKFRTVTRMTVGEKNPDKPNKTILLVGETGAGKSTLVNVLFNYSMGVKWEDEVWFQIVEEERNENQTESQTPDVIVYEIFGFEDETLPYSLTIIDTPGYGDTRGAEHDDIISQRLLELFGSEDGVHELNSVGLVMKATDNQLSEQLMYAFDSVMSLFEKTLEKNIVALITHSDGKRPRNAFKAIESAKFKCAKNEKNQPVYFLFNNSQHEARGDEEEEEYLKHDYEISEKGMRKFKVFLRKTTPLKTTHEASKEFIRLTACIQNLQERIKFTEVKEREMKQTQEALKEHEEEMKMNDELTAFDAEVYKHKELIRKQMFGPGFKAAVSCTVCQENCHYPGCIMALTHCEVFIDGRCTSCTGKCPVTDHVKEEWRYVTRIRKVQKKEAKMTQSDKKDQTESEKKFSHLQNFENEMNKLAAEKSQFLDESYQHVVRLEQIALKADSASTIVHLDFLIEKMKEEGDTEKVQKLQEMRSRVDEGTKEALLYKTSVISSQYEDILSNSFLIHSGPPTVYQLRTEKQKFGSLTKMTVGEKNQYKTNRTILLVGETGAGKSTLINALLNYSMGVKWEDEVWFQIVEEEKRSQTESQTLDVIVYEVFGFEDKTLPYSLTIIDTPGFGDTSGTEHDDIISQRLFDLFRSEDGVHELNSVGLVMKATDNRLSDRLRYIFSSMMSLFGKNLEKNIVALFTHSNGRTPENALQTLKVANIKCSRNEKNEPVYFLFDNCQDKQRTEEIKALKHSWKVTQKEMGRLADFLGKPSPQKLMRTVEVLNERIRLNACIQNLHERIEFIEERKNEIKQTQDALKEHEEDMKKNEKFSVELTEVYKVKERIKRHFLLGGYVGAVCCQVCEETCHYPGCTIAWRPEYCEVMKGGRCTSCTKGCPASDHVKEKWRYVTKKRIVERTKEEMKEKYEKYKTESKNTLSLLENLENEMKKLTAEKSQFLDESYQHLEKLDQIALNVFSLSTVVHLDFLIGKMKEEGNTEKVQKLEGMRSRVDEGTRAALRYKFVQIPSAMK